MEDRVGLPVSLPRENPTRSYWHFDIDEIADLRSTESLPNEADTVIIGSGITGAGVAFNLLSNGSRNVLMVEARQACSGATGRNGISSPFLYNIAVKLIEEASCRWAHEGSILLHIPTSSKRAWHRDGRQDCAS
jgi:glycine/D-amino acid oxidase-like deaminating enzyme